MHVFREETRVRVRVKSTILVPRAFSLAWGPWRGGSPEVSPRKRSGSIHSTKVCGYFALKLIGSVKFHKSRSTFRCKALFSVAPWRGLEQAGQPAGYTGVVFTRGVYPSIYKKDKSALQKF